MFRLHTLKKLFVLLALLLITTANSAYALTINSVRFGNYPDKTRLVIELDQETQFRSFVLPDPYRMVIDLPTFYWDNTNIQDQNAAGINAVRHGNLKPSISRIVFDLNRPISIHSAFTLPADKANNKPSRLVIDFANTNASGFASAQKIIHGDLNVDDIQEVSAAAPLPTPPSHTHNKKPLIIIDPGHGGVDPGALGPDGIQEKNVVLALAKELQKQLESSGQYRTKMTRNDDTFIKLSDRVKYARKHEGDLFISLHADSIKDPSINGASFYTLSEKASDAQTAKLAARENKADLIAGIELEVDDAAVMDILIDLARRNTQNQSKYFANILIDDFKGNNLQLLRSANRHANFAVLKAHDIPSVLVETGFMSNTTEARKLNGDPHRKKVASALKKGIDAYFKTVKDNERS